MNAFQEQEQKRRRAFWRRQWDRRNEYLLVLLSLAVLAWLHTRHQREIEMLGKKIRHDLEVNRLLDSLRVPSEALYTERNALEKINEFRSQAYKGCGAKRMLTYDQVSRSGEESTDVILNKEGGELQFKKTWTAFKPGDGAPTDDPRMFWSDTVEGYWQSRNAGAGLAEELRRNIGLGRYFNEHKNEFNGRIRPLVTRLLGSCHPGFRLDGCAILLAAGERSEEIVGILAEYARQPDVEKEAQINGQTVRKPFPSPEKERALRLAQESGLKLAP